VLAEKLEFDDENPKPKRQVIDDSKQSGESHASSIVQEFLLEEEKNGRYEASDSV